MQEKLKSLLQKLPHKPGVYKMKDKEGRILYVGKAKDLSKRVKSYFIASKNRAVRTEKLLEQVEDLEWSEVESEFEALVLETNLIKELRPKYNVLMKDDKNFVYIKITKNEDYPQIRIVRRVEKDNARYFGPKSSASQVKKTLILLQKLFPYRSCHLDINWKAPNDVEIKHKTISYPCLDYHIKRCAGPCIGAISPEEYRESIEQIERFLEGKTKEIEGEIEQKMIQLAKDRQFEKAALLRDRLSSIRELSQKQLVSSPEQTNRDIWNFTLDSEKAYFVGFIFREGKLISQENFVLNAKTFFAGDEEEAEEVLESFLLQYYEHAAHLPQEIVIPLPIESDLLEEWFQRVHQVRVSLVKPERGKKHRLLDLARKNSESFCKQEKARFEKGENSKLLEEMKDLLELPSLPKRIEGYDISHLGGSNTVASMVVFENGNAKNSDYRRFHLRSLSTNEIDDFKCMNEILFRRLSHLKSPKGLLIKQKKLSEEKSKIALYKDETLFAEWTLQKGTHHSAFIENCEDFLKFSKEEAYLYLRALIQKLKLKRVYAISSEEQCSFLEEYGFKKIKSFPQTFAYSFEKPVEFLAYEPQKDFDPSFKEKPDLILIDGGKGQLNAALQALSQFDLKIPLISLAKREEEIFIPKVKNSLVLPKNSPLLQLLQRIRDEAHRFAIGFQRNTRKKDLTASFLDDIPGLGPVKRRKLLQTFGSLEGIKKASSDELKRVLGPKETENLLKAFDNSNN